MSESRGMSVMWLWLAPVLLVTLVLLIQWLPLFAVKASTGGGTSLPGGSGVGGVRLYTPLELRGRDIYLREGCSGCHSQLVRLLDSDIARYGSASRAAETVFEHPVRWGLRRYGPDLSRIAGKYPDSWYRQTLSGPRRLDGDSNMPAYSWLLNRRLSYADLPGRLKVLRRVGVPYSLTKVEFERNVVRYGAGIAAQLDIHQTEASLLMQARRHDYDGNPALVSELDALIAYLQVTGLQVNGIAESNMAGSLTDGAAEQ